MGKLLTRGLPILFLKRSLYSMKIKEQTRKLAAGCSKQCFEVVDRTDEVSNHTYGKVTLTWFEFDFRRVLVNNLIKEK
ncbi:hypothetical protein HMPREF9965_1573 [Streptococcus mitis bv. 2 str. SK95]|uniref:Chlorohydrolase domain protein n=1 Tax=Streptococcus mitis bv. 2 str. SK95 TaxID=1000588 RepID=F9LVZ4_STROR|nr:hypothetical protein HMPREF9965_1573 [Streptococcus mitis bv. 2 str. SK95]